MKMLHKRMLSMVLACIMFFSMMSIPSLGSGSANPILTATASTDLPIDPIQNHLYGSWSTYQYYLSSDPVNSMIYSNGEDIVSVIDKARNPYSYPTIYLTSSAFFTWQVKKGVYNSQTNSYDFKDISDGNFTDNSDRATHLSSYYNYVGNKSKDSIQLFVAAKDPTRTTRILIYEENLWEPEEYTWRDITPTDFTLPFTADITTKNGGLIFASNNKLFL